MFGFLLVFGMQEVKIKIYFLSFLISIYNCYILVLVVNIMIFQILLYSKYSGNGRVVDVAEACKDAMAIILMFDLTRRCTLNKLVYKICYIFFYKY